MKISSGHRRSVFLCLLLLPIALVFPVLAGEASIPETGTLIRVDTGDLEASSCSLSDDSIFFVSQRDWSSPADLSRYRIADKKINTVRQGWEGPNPPRVSGNRVVFARSRTPDGRNTTVRSDIYLLDLATGKAAFLGTSTKDLPDVAISGDTVVWETGTDEPVWPGLTNTRNYFTSFNLPERRKTDIVSDLPDNPEGPVIDGDLVVYSGVSHGPADQSGRYTDFTSDIFCYNLSSGKEVQLSSSGRAYNPVVSGPLVTWEDTRGGNVDIYLYNLSSREETAICQDPADQRNPKISGTWVVWEDKRHQPAPPPARACPKGEYCPVETAPPPVTDIYLYDLATKKETCISVAPGTPYQSNGDNQGPAVSQGRVAWTRGGELMLYSVTGGKAPTITTGTRPTGKVPLQPTYQAWKGPLKFSFPALNSSRLPFFTLFR
jgi:beta propeller repeat protein